MKNVLFIFVFILYSCNNSVQEVEIKEVEEKQIVNEILLYFDLELIKDIDHFISKFNSATIYGAGHQTLMMLPMIKNIDKIPYIVDDFKPKQNTYTYVKSKKIVSRDNLITNPVDAIIIIVGWQYKHALKNIESLNLNPKPHIALIKKATLEAYEDF
jgi:transcriptional regulator of heat shock response